jgi:hypothetical protein
MTDFLVQNAATLLVGAAVALLVLLAALKLARDRKRGRTACGSCCSGCAMAGSCHSSKKCV